MKLALFALLVAFGADAILGKSWVVIKNETVYVEDKPLNLDSLKVIADTPYAKKYFYQSGDTNVTITKLKVGNGISVSAISRGSPEDIAKMEEMRKELAKNITKKATELQNEVTKQIQEINNQIKSNLKGMFSVFPSMF